MAAPASATFCAKAIARDCAPGRTPQRQQRHACGLGGPRRIGGDDRRIRMGGVDQRLEPLRHQMSAQSLRAAEAAHTHRHRLRSRMGGAARERQGHREIVAAGEALPQLPRLRGAAQNDDAARMSRLDVMARTTLLQRRAGCPSSASARTGSKVSSAVARGTLYPTPRSCSAASAISPLRLRFVRGANAAPGHRRSPKTASRAGAGAARPTGCACSPPAIPITTASARCWRAMWSRPRPWWCRRPQRSVWRAARLGWPLAECARSSSARPRARSPASASAARRLRAGA